MSAVPIDDPEYCAACDGNRSSAERSRESREPMGDVLYIRPLPDDATCEVHDWPTEGLGVRLVAAMRETHPEGLKVCTPCIGRARLEVERFRAARGQLRYIGIRFNREDRRIEFLMDSFTHSWSTRPLVALTIDRTIRSFASVKICEDPKPGERPLPAGSAGPRELAAAIQRDLVAAFPDETIEVKPA